MCEGCYTAGKKSGLGGDARKLFRDYRSMDKAKQNVYTPRTRFCGTKEKVLAGLVVSKDSQANLLHLCAVSIDVCDF